MKKNIQKLIENEEEHISALKQALEAYQRLNALIEERKSLEYNMIKVQEAFKASLCNSGAITEDQNAPVPSPKEGEQETETPEQKTENPLAPYITAKGQLRLQELIKNEYPNLIRAGFVGTGKLLWETLGENKPLREALFWKGKEMARNRHIPDCGDGLCQAARTIIVHAFAQALHFRRLPVPGRRFCIFFTEEWRHEALNLIEMYTKEGGAI